MSYTYIQLKTLKMGKPERKRLKIINIKTEINKITKAIVNVNKTAGYFLRHNYLPLSYQLVSVVLQSF